MRADEYHSNTTSTMPTTHVLAAVRKRCGLSQEQLAAAVGVATVTIQKIEYGKIALSPRLACRISIATRLRTQQLLANSDPDRLQLLPDFSAGKIPKEILVAESVQLGNIERDMLDQCDTQAKFWVLRWAIYEKLRELGKDFGLRVRQPATREVFKVQAARKREPRVASPGSGNGEKRSATRSRVPSVRPSRGRA